MALGRRGFFWFKKAAGPKAEFTTEVAESTGFPGGRVARGLCRRPLGVVLPRNTGPPRFFSVNSVYSVVKWGLSRNHAVRSVVLA